MSNLIKLVESRRLPAPAERKAIRVQAGVTQAEIAAQVGVHRITVARWEAGKHAPRQDKAVRAYGRLLRRLQEVAG